MKTIEQYKKILQERGLFFLVINTLKGFFYIAKWENLKAYSNELKSYRYLKTYYSSVKIEQQTPVPLCNKIWVCWLQGIDFAPLIAEKCINSIKTYCRAHEIVVITYQNLKGYIDIPQYIEEKHKQGIISPAHYSDVVRTMLLVKHGGIWIDATVLLTSSIPAAILSSDFFCYKATTKALTKIKASNWFILSKPNNPILLNVQNMLFRHWEKENAANYYFFYHLFFSIAINKNKECAQIWSKMPKYANYKNHLLQSQLLKSYSKEVFEDICKETSVHKLTYKLSIDDKKNIEGSFYEFIIKNF